MKKVTWLASAVLVAAVALLLVFCRKSEVPDVREKAPASAERKSTVRVGIGNPPPIAEKDTEVNSRTRPLPRPEDPKHKPAPPVNVAHPVAVAVEGKPGFVMSPFNSKIIDVRELPPGTLVADPTYPAEEQKYFRVP